MTTWGPLDAVLAELGRADLPTAARRQHPQGTVAVGRHGTARLHPAAVGLWLANAAPQDAAGQGPAAPSEPGRLGVGPGQDLAPASPNQQLADAVADRLRQGGRLQQFRVEVAVTGGAVELCGQVAGP